MRRSTPTRRVAAWAPAWAAVLLAAAGCTICPDPFDYTGPVPDGSAPQNDFRARANGLAPLDATPVPWPPVVQAAPARDDESRTVIAALQDATPDPGQVPAVDEDQPLQPVAAEADADEPEPEAPMQPVADEPTLEALLPAAAPRPEIVPPLRETPGWRPRG